MTTYARCLVGLLVLASLAGCVSPTDPLATIYYPPVGVTPAVAPVSNTVTSTAPRTQGCRPLGPRGGCKVNPAGAP